MHVRQFKIELAVKTKLQENGRAWFCRSQQQAYSRAKLNTFYNKHLLITSIMPAATYIQCTCREFTLSFNPPQCLTYIKPLIYCKKRSCKMLFQQQCTPNIQYLRLAFSSCIIILNIKQNTGRKSYHQM